MSLFECPEEAEAVFPLAMMELRQAFLQIKPKRLSKDWVIRWLQTRTGPENCYICGQDMSQPGEYRAIDGKKVCCVPCYEGLPLCGQCGKGSKKQFCRECIGKK